MLKPVITAKWESGSNLIGPFDCALVMLCFGFVPGRKASELESRANFEAEEI